MTELLQLLWALVQKKKKNSEKQKLSILEQLLGLPIKLAHLLQMAKKETFETSGWNILLYIYKLML